MSIPTITMESHEHSIKFSICARYCAEGYDSTKFFRHSGEVKRHGITRKDAEETLIRQLCAYRWPGVGNLVRSEITIG